VYALFALQVLNALGLHKFYSHIYDEFETEGLHRQIVESIYSFKFH